MIPHPIQKVSKNNDDDDQGLEEPEVCLIVKEESKPWVQELIAKFPEHMGFVKKVLGLDSLRKKYSKFGQRRELLHKYSHFMADDRILPMLTQALGRDFIKAKKQPIPVAITRKEALPLTIQKALSATYMFLSPGTCLTIKAGNTGMPARKLVENILAIAGSYEKDQLGAIYRIPRQWANVRSIGIKTTESTALPIYNKTPTELMQIAELAGLDSVWKEARKQVKKPKTSGEEEKKRKLEKVKSPLVRALKKQKAEKEKMSKRELESKEPSGESPPKKAKKESAKKAKKQESTPDAKKAEAKSSSNKKKKTEEAASPATPAVKKAETRSTRSSSKKIKAEETASPATPASKKKAEAKTSSTKKKKTEENVTPVAKKAEAKTSSSKKTKEDSAKKSKESFVASKKFKGSKKGYMFQQGSKGIGYYLDSKPVVDRMAMEAFARMASQNKKSPGGGRRKSGGGSGKKRGRR
jgi:ribosome biogenesis protein UTP30